MLKDLLDYLILICLSQRRNIRNPGWFTADYLVIWNV